MVNLASIVSPPDKDGSVGQLDQNFASQPITSRDRHVFSWSLNKPAARALSTPTYGLFIGPPVTAETFQGKVSCCLGASRPSRIAPTETTRIPTDWCFVAFFFLLILPLFFFLWWVDSSMSADNGSYRGLIRSLVGATRFQLGLHRSNHFIYTL